jgi:hypothetical protein
MIRGLEGRVLSSVETTDWRRFRAVAGGLLGALTLVGGLTWVILNMPGPRPVDAVAGIVLAAGGLVLLMPHRIRLPGLLTSASAVSAGVAGTAVGLAAGTAQLCCAFAYEAARGWPFRWVDRGGLADDPATARELALGSSWHVDLVGLGGDLLFWAYAGMLTVVIVMMVRRTVGDRDGDRVTVA